MHKQGGMKDGGERRREGGKEQLGHWDVYLLISHPGGVVKASPVTLTCTL